MAKKSTLTPDQLKKKQDILDQLKKDAKNKRSRQTPSKTIDPDRLKQVQDVVKTVTKRDKLSDVVSRTPSAQSLKKKEASMKWFYSKIQQSFGVDQHHNAYNPVKDPFIGGMFFFKYDAKHKDTLPYWDAFPLSIPVEIYNDGFLGLNVHYLPPMLRAKLLDALFDLKGKKSNRHYMKVSYKLLAQIMKTPYFAPCVKRYLTTHIKSKFIKVSHDEWEYAAFLPVSEFQKASEREVWADSKKRIG